MSVKARLGAPNGIPEYCTAESHDGITQGIRQWIAWMRNGDAVIEASRHDVFSLLDGFQYRCWFHDFPGSAGNFYKCLEC